MWPSTWVHVQSQGELQHLLANARTLELYITLLHKLIVLVRIASISREFHVACFLDTQTGREVPPIYIVILRAEKGAYTLLFTCHKRRIYIVFYSHFVF